MEDAHKGNKPETIGEELYLVHLQRREGEEPREEDFDLSSDRKREHDAGEELWEVHLKRSRGLVPDLDLDTDKNEEAIETSPPKECRYNLRSKDAKKCTQ
jgi:hypothetical protein